MLAAFCCKRMREGKIGVFYASLALKKGGGKEERHCGWLWKQACYGNERPLATVYARVHVRHATKYEGA